MYKLGWGLGKTITIVFVVVSFYHGFCVAAQQPSVHEKRISHQRGYSAGSLDGFSFQLRMTVDLNNLKLALDEYRDLVLDQIVIVGQLERDIDLALAIIWQLYHHIFHLTKMYKEAVFICFPKRKKKLYTKTIELVKYIETHYLVKWRIIGSSLLRPEIMMPLTQLIDDFLTLYKPFGVQELSY
ncbi:hypothetical protein IPF37_01285 [bacterium]|nr:MAG: hypothetical protein IPF37_01285 [bacterium]